jgi:Papain-like cysteine protease AvrRpt2
MYCRNEWGGRLSTWALQRCPWPKEIPPWRDLASRFRLGRFSPTGELLASGRGLTVPGHDHVELRYSADDVGVPRRAGRLGMGVLQGLCSHNGILFATWKGEVGDDRLFYSTTTDGEAWVDQQMLGGNSSTGPSSTVFRGDLVLAWKGEHADERLFSLKLEELVWFPQQLIAGFGSSVGPSLAEYDDRLFASWKGAGSDQAIWYAHFDESNWSAQAQIPGVGTAIGPALCVYDNLLIAAWRGMNNDQALWWASFDGIGWSAQSLIPGVASSVGPSLAVVGGKLYAAWKGVTGDEAIWYGSFDGGAWAPQQTIPGAESSIGPAIAEFNGKLYAMWKGPGSDQSLHFSSFDGTNWAAPGSIPGNTGQDTPQNIGLRMQYQEMTQWCWIAVAVSVANYYGNTLPEQCETMTMIGQQINKWSKFTSCCPTIVWREGHRDMQAALEDPYDKAALYVLDNDPNLPAVCNKSGGVNASLALYDNYAGAPASMTLEAIAAEIDAKRPVVVDLQWPGNGPQHVVAIVGVLDDQLLIVDPIYGETAIGYEEFPASYQGGATLHNWLTTKAP